MHGMQGYKYSWYAMNMSTMSHLLIDSHGPWMCHEQVLNGPQMNNGWIVNGHVFMSHRKAHSYVKNSPPHLRDSSNPSLSIEYKQIHYPPSYKCISIYFFHFP